MNRINSLEQSIINAVALNLESNEISYVVNEDGTISTTLPINIIKVPQEMLRTVKEKSIPKMVAGLQAEGQIMPLSVKPVVSETGEVTFYLYDGLQRLTAMALIKQDYLAKVTIGNFTLMSSVIANFARVNQDTKEVISAVKFMLDKGESFAEISKKLNLSEVEVNKWFTLGSLTEVEKGLLSTGELTHAQASVLAECRKRGDLSQEQIEILRDNALGTALDSEGKPKSVASSAEMKSIAKTMRVLNSQAKREALGISSTVKQYGFVEQYSADRLQEMKLKADALEGSESEDLTERQTILMELIDYLYMRTPEDRAAHRAAWDKKEADKKALKQ